jgi:hypothetical protein
MKRKITFALLGVLFFYTFLFLAAYILSGEAYHSFLLKEMLFPMFLMILALVAGWFFFDYMEDNSSSPIVQTLQAEDPLRYYEKHYRSRIYRIEKEHQQSIRGLLYFIVLIIIFAYNTATIPKATYYNFQVIFGKVEEKVIQVEKTERPNHPIFESVKDYPIKDDFFYITDRHQQTYKNFNLHQFNEMSKGEFYKIRYTKDTHIIISAEFQP